MGKSSVFKLACLFMVFSTTVFFVGCGGGGGGGGVTPESSGYSISGKVTGSVIQGVTITLLSNSGSKTATTNSSGKYSFSDLEDGSYNVSASRAGYIFTPSSKNVDVDGANVPNINFVATTSSGTTFQLFPDGFLTAGYTESYDLTGSNTSGAAYTATLDVTTQSQTTFNSAAAIPVEHQLHLTNTVTHISGTLTSTDYHTTSLSDHEYLGFHNANYGNTASGPSLFAIPESAAIGDSGDIGTYTYSNGNVQTLTWELNDAGSGFAIFVITSTIKDSTGDTLSTEESSYVIDQDGVRESVTMVLYSSSQGVTITLSGPKS
jgi:hypothetical protein